MKKKRNRETHESPDANAKQSRYSYADCLRDEVPVPSSASGNLLYQLLLVAGLVIFEMSVSGAIESGASFFAHARWLFLLVFCIALFVRLYIGVPVINFLTPKVIGSHMRGLSRGVLKTVLSVCITSPITSAIITALFADPDDFATVYIEALSTTMPMTMFVSFFIVGPAVKLVCNNRVSSAGSMRILLDMKNYAPALSRLLGM